MATTIEQLRLDEYHLKREADRIATQLYGEGDHKDDAKLAEVLGKLQTDVIDASRKRRKAEAAAGAGAIADSTGKAGRQMLGLGTTEIEARVTLRMAQVPTAIAHLLDVKTPLVTFTIKNARTKALRVRVTAEVLGYSARAIETCEIDPGGEAVVDQLPTLYPEELHKIGSLTRASLAVMVQDLDGGTVEQQRTYPIWLLARTSAYLAMEDPSTGGWIDLTRYLGAWVTPDAPAVMDLLRAAAAAHPDKQIVGYQVDALGVEAQVKAVFEALKAADVRYVNSVLSFAPAGGFATQRIRLPREALETRSANCIDGTVLMASVLEAASLRPAIVLVPGHAFLAWETQRGSGSWDYVETTMIAKASFAQARDVARERAARQERVFKQTNEPAHFRRLPLHELRAVHGIYPME
ncbi:MAG TPA: hypothetical protein VFL83_14170 [Anaeromyxobacter sp.]|nr:hypothetical protein [Anaeromyxobacter sp.]